MPFKPPRIVALSFALIALTACDKPKPAAEPPRPVRTIVAQPGLANAALEFSGEVQPRIETALSFRVPGKLIERRVEVGQVVKANQALARLDPQDLRLAQQAAQAQLDAAIIDRDLASADYKRFEDLFKRNFISGAELDRRKATLDAAQARFAQAQANSRNQSNQAGYAELVANAAGVITAIDAEVGQVLAAGQSVMRLARTDEKEVSIAVPEDRVDQVRALRRATVTIWALPGKTFDAVVREIAPAADPATRTYAVRLALTQEPEAIRLGMTAVARFSAAGAALVIRLPLTALTQVDGKTFVWVVDDQTSTVAQTPIELAGPSGDEVLVASGLQAGQRVVTAGVNLLQAGQVVKPLDGEPAATPVTQPNGAR